MPTEESRIVLPAAPDALGDRAVKAWREPVAIDTYEPAAPDRYPAYLDQRVYQGSSGAVYPLPFIDARRPREGPARMGRDPHRERVRAADGPARIRRHASTSDSTRRAATTSSTATTSSNRPSSGSPGRGSPAASSSTGPSTTGPPPTCRPSPRSRWRTTARSPSGAPTTTRSRACRACTASACGPAARSIELRGHLVNRSEDDADLPVVGQRGGRRRTTSTSRSSPPTCAWSPTTPSAPPPTFPAAEGRYYGVDYPARRTSERPDADRLDWYRNIPVPTSYMCLGSEDDFFGGYDHGAGAGFVHWADHRIAPGKKQWTWGNAPFGWAWDAHLTDANGPYVELMAGVFTDNQPDFAFLAPGETKTFSQYWYPIQETGPVHQATLDAAVRLDRDPMRGDTRADRRRGHQLRAGARVVLRVGDRVVSKTKPTWPPVLRSSTRSTRGQVADQTANRPGRSNPRNANSRRARRRDALDLATPTRARRSGSRRSSDRARRISRHEASHRARRAGRLRPSHRARRTGYFRSATAPAGSITVEPATEPPAPADIASADELYLTGLHLDQYRHATRSPEPYWEEALRRDPGDARCQHRARCPPHATRATRRSGTPAARAVARLTRRNPNPRDGEAHYRLGLVLVRHGREAEAKEAFGKAQWDQAWRTPPPLRQPGLDLAAGRDARSAGELRAIVHRSPGLTQARNLLAVALLRRAERAPSGRDRGGDIAGQPTRRLGPRPRSPPRPREPSPRPTRRSRSTSPSNTARSARTGRQIDLLETAASLAPGRRPGQRRPAGVAPSRRPRIPARRRTAAADRALERVRELDRTWCFPLGRSTMTPSMRLRARRPEDPGRRAARRAPALRRRPARRGDRRSGEIDVPPAPTGGGPGRPSQPRRSRPQRPGRSGGGGPLVPRARRRARRRPAALRSRPVGRPSRRRP